MLVLNYVGLAIGLAISAILLGFAVRLFRADRLESKKSAHRVASLTDALMGRARTKDDWVSDGRIKGGMVYNRDKKRLEISGRLSNDTLNRIFR